MIDHDPASGCFYAPVDLNDPHLLATDGLAPSEGNPKFHQQMVYAVAMRTINNFEQALGRKALWSPRMHGKDDREYVRQLSIYPHALRECNAYYHPEKKALLFGYFPATAADPGQLYPGGMVFTCLSHDIVAHETTHALLDGMHRRLSEAEQRGSVGLPRGLCRHRGPVPALLHAGGVAPPDRQGPGRFAGPQPLGRTGPAVRPGQRHARRLAQRHRQSGPRHRRVETAAARSRAFQRETEPHARGALLVAAVFDAFLSIYETRTGDLLRLATSGKGLLPVEALHPDLVNRLSEEAAMVAQHVLTMCVRALDYCPPVDLTFGDYLRALITADFDLVPNDIYDYRVAFVEAFRRRGIYPRDLPTLSIDSLRWRPADGGRQPGPAPAACSQNWANSSKNSKGWSHAEEDVRSHPGLAHKGACNFGRTSLSVVPRMQRLKLMAALGLDLTTGEEHFEVHQLRVSNKQGPDEAVRPQILLYLIQEKRLPGEAAVGEGPLTFSGGCTIIADQYSRKVNYYVSKNILSESRRQRLRAFNAGLRQGLSALYFGASPLSGMAQRFAMLHAEREDR